MSAILEKTSAPRQPSVGLNDADYYTQMAAELRAECNTHTEEQCWEGYQQGLEMIRKAGNGHVITAFQF